MTVKFGFKEISTVISAIIAVSSIIYAMGVKDANKDNHSARIEKNVNLLLTNDSLKTLQLGEVIRIMNDHLEANKMQSQAVTALTKSVNSLALKVAETPGEYAKIMQGLTFEVVETKSYFPDTKIKITPIK